MRVVMSSIPHHLSLLLSDYRGIAKWFGAHYNQQVHIRSAVKCKKGPQVLTSLLISLIIIKDESIIIITIIICVGKPTAPL